MLKLHLNSYRINVGSSRRNENSSSRVSGFNKKKFGWEGFVDNTLHSERQWSEGHQTKRMNFFRTRGSTKTIHRRPVSDILHHLLLGLDEDTNGKNHAADKN
ncbi:unnamed protein product [Caenorhabditis nigoni]